MESLTPNLKLKKYRENETTEQSRIFQHENMDVLDQQVFTTMHGMLNLYQTALIKDDGGTINADLEVQGQIIPTFYPSGRLTIPKDGWTVGTGDYPRYIDIDIEGLSKDHAVDVDIEVDSLKVAQKAKICSTIESFDGKLRIRAEKALTASVKAEYRTRVTKVIPPPRKPSKPKQPAPLQPSL